MKNNMALEALLKAAKMDPSVSKELIEKSFAIEKRHQFDRDDARDVSMQELKKLLNAMIEREEPL